MECDLWCDQSSIGNCVASLDIAREQILNGARTSANQIGDLDSMTVHLRSPLQWSNGR